MENYEYKFVSVPTQGGLRAKPGDTFEACKQAILDETRQGWRLVQVVTPFNEKMGVSAPLGYEIIFERAAE